MNQTISTPKRLLVINSMASVGRCSISAALPVISCCKVQACPLPTSVFSNHLGFPTHYSVDLSSDLPEFFSHLKLLPVTFDGILCGFLNSESLIDTLIKEFSENQKSFIIIDPIMGDNGTPYKTVTDAFIKKMKLLLPFASLITPNLTEACLLTDTPFSSSFSEEEILCMAKKLRQTGAKNVIITGIETETTVSNAILDCCDAFHLQTAEKILPVHHGTGDIFVSVVSALSLRGYSLTEASRIASEFISECLKISKNIPVKEGVALENCLDFLFQLIK